MVAVLALSYAYGKVGNPTIPPRLSAMEMAGDHMPMLTATAADSFTRRADPLPESRWTATASDQSGSYPASNAIDGNSATVWASNPHVRLPHSITINMHAVHYVSGLTYLPRQDASYNGDIGEYSISVSVNGKRWGSPVATGTWADDKTLRSAEFGGVAARYVRLTALTEASDRGPWTSAAEIGLLSDPPIGPALPRAGWTASADSEEPGQGAGNVLDGDGETIWQTAYSGTVAPLPHFITIDMHARHVVTGLAYLPRQDGILNGTIGQYSISVSTNGVSWGTPVASGTWANDYTQKYAIFAPVSTRYVRLTALSEAGDRGPWSSAGEINILGVAPSAAVGGRWGAPIGFPVVPVSAVMLPDDVGSPGTELEFAL